MKPEVGQVWEFKGTGNDSGVYLVTRVQTHAYGDQVYGVSLWEGAMVTAPAMELFIDNTKAFAADNWVRSGFFGRWRRIA